MLVVADGVSSPRGLGCGHLGGDTITGGGEVLFDCGGVCELEAASGGDVCGCQLAEFYSAYMTLRVGLYVGFVFGECHCRIRSHVDPGLRSFR